MTAAPDALFKALADPTRREILALLRDGGSTVGEIASNFHMSRPAVSKPLRQLRAAGLVVDRPLGTARVCELRAEPLRAVDDWLTDYRVFLAEEARAFEGARRGETSWQTLSRRRSSSSRSSSTPRSRPSFAR